MLGVAHMPHFQRKEPAKFGQVSNIINNSVLLDVSPERSVLAWQAHASVGLGDKRFYEL
jgi:hypothetical protein